MINNALAACMVVQDTYGKRAEDLPAYIAVLKSDLAAYSFEQVFQAIKTWRQTAGKFPTIADLLQLIDPQPVYNHALYSSVKEKLAKNPDWYEGRSDDVAYVKFCEKHLRGHR